MTWHASAWLVAFLMAPASDSMTNADTWGFQFHGYGHQQQITGLESKDRCETIRLLLSERRMASLIGPCKLDTEPR